MSRIRDSFRNPGRVWWINLLVLAPALYCGFWFKKGQLSLLTPLLPPLYPIWGWVDSILSSCLIFLILSALDQIWIKLLSSREKYSRNFFLNSLSYFLFLGLALDIPLRVLFLLFIGNKISLMIFLLIKGGFFQRPTLKMHLKAFVILLLAQVIYNSFLTPLRWKDPIVALDLYESAVTPLNAATHRGSYINAKQWDFTGFDDSNWGMAIPSLSGRSQVLGWVSFLLDLPSMDVKMALRAMLIMAFIACVLASFGFFCLCLHSFHLLPSTALWGGCLYVLGNFFIASSITHYFPLFFCVYMPLPYALLLIEKGMNKRRPLWAFASGFVLSLHLYLFQSHPEAIINGTLFFLLFLCFLQWENLRQWKSTILLTPLPFLALGLSAFWLYASIIQSIYQKDIQILGHQDYYICIWGLSYSKPVIRMLILGLLPLLIMGGLSRNNKDRPLLKEPRFIFFLGFALILGIATLPGRDSPVIQLIERLQILKSFNLWVPARLWTYLFLPGLMAGLFSMDFFLRAKNKRKTWVVALGLLLLFGFLWRLKGYWPLHHSETYLSPIFLLGVVFFLWEENRSSRIGFAAYALVFLASSTLLIHSATLSWPNLQQEKNSQNCFSYLSTESLLAKYEGLSFDSNANNRVLRERLQHFEDDLGRYSSIKAKAEFNERVKQFGVSMVLELKAEQLYPLAKNSATLIDDFYFGSEAGCLYSTEKSYGWGTGVWHNLAALFRPIADKHFRSLDSTGQTHHFGIAEGQILNDATTGFDGAFMQGYPPLYSLYVSPGNYHDSPGDFSPQTATTMFFGVNETLLDPFRRKIFNVAGIDAYTIFSLDLPKLKNISDLELLASNPRNLSGQRFSLVSDRRSYGVAYLADEVRYVSPSINAMEKYPFPLFKRAPNLIPEYRKQVDLLHAKLLSLNKAHATYLELAERDGSVLRPPVENDMKIIGLSGAKAAFQVYCHSEPCLLVYNIANIHGWTAYLDEKPVPIRRANFAFMGVEVTKGKHLVWFEHERLLTLISRYLSWSALLIFLCLVARNRGMQSLSKPFGCS